MYNRLVFELYNKYGTVELCVVSGRPGPIDTSSIWSKTAHNYVCTTINIKCKSLVQLFPKYISNIKVDKCNLPSKKK